MTGNVTPLFPPQRFKLRVTLSVVDTSARQPRAPNVLYDRTGMAPPDGEWATARGLLADLAREVCEWQAQDDYMAQLDGGGA